jgi:malate synthase
MNAWARGFFGREIVGDWRAQLGFTTKIFRARGLHLDDRHVREEDGTGFSASIVDLVLYVVNNQRCCALGRPVVLYLPKIQTAEEAALWNRLLSALEAHLGLPHGTIKAYVLVEQLEAAFQLMEIRAALGAHFVGFNTGRWDYINSVSDALAWDRRVRESEHRRDHHDLRLHAPLRGPRAPRREHARSRMGARRSGRAAWSPTSPWARRPGVAAGMKRAVAGAEREQRAGASGKWVAHWKMVHIVRPVWERAGRPISSAAPSRALTYTPPTPRPWRARAGATHGARRARPAERGPAVRQRLRPGLPGGGAQAGGLLRQRRRALPHGGHGDRRDPPEHPLGVAAQAAPLHRGRRRHRRPRRRHVFTPALFERLLDEEYDKLLAARDRDVDYTVAREAAAAFHARLRELFAERSASPPSARTRPARP